MTKKWPSTIQIKVKAIASQREQATALGASPGLVSPVFCQMNFVGCVWGEEKVNLSLGFSMGWMESEMDKMERGRGEGNRREGERGGREGEGGRGRGRE